MAFFEKRPGSFVCLQSETFTFLLLPNLFFLFLLNLFFATQVVVQVFVFPVIYGLVGYPVTAPVADGELRLYAGWVIIQITVFGFVVTDDVNRFGQVGYGVQNNVVLFFCNVRLFGVMFCF